MMATTMTALVYLFITKYLPAKATALMGADVVLLVLAVLVIILTARTIFSPRVKENQVEVSEEVLAKGRK